MKKIREMIKKYFSAVDKWLLFFCVSISVIGITTFIFSIIGVFIGNRFGVVYKSKAELAGGIILVLLGLKILLEHLGVIGSVI